MSGGEGGRGWERGLWREKSGVREKGCRRIGQRSHRKRRRGGMKNGGFESGLLPTSGTYRRMSWTTLADHEHLVIAQTQFPSGAKVLVGGHFSQILFEDFKNVVFSKILRFFAESRIALRVPPAETRLTKTIFKRARGERAPPCPQPCKPHLRFHYPR